MRTARKELAEEFTEMKGEINLLWRKLDYVLKENLARSGQDPLSFYLAKLKDRNFTSTYGEGHTFHIAAKELGAMGKPTIPHLIQKLDTKDDYERTQILYALLLASQQGNVKSFTRGEFVKRRRAGLPAAGGASPSSQSLEGLV